MDHLSEGIKIHLDSPDSLVKEHRVYLSSGTYQPSISISSGIRYCSNAFLPKEPWREPSEAELGLLFARSPNLDPSRCITVFRLPNDAFVGLEKIGLSSVSNIESLLALRKHAHYQNAIESILDNLRLWFCSTEGLVVNPIVANPPNLQSVTYDEGRGCYIGLHLDSWDRSPLKEREKARNRICINMGTEDRYLVFINLTLIDMFQYFDGDTGLNHIQEEKWQGETFMERNSSYPTVRLRIAPYEAYIAPTENMIHDGCTAGQSKIDMTLQLRGFFASSPWRR